MTDHVNKTEDIPVEHASEPVEGEVLSSGEATEEEAPAARPQRPATLVFTQTVLALQALVALFATLVLWSFARHGLLNIEPWAVLVVGFVLIIALALVSRHQDTRWGRFLGWALQFPMLAAVFLEPAVAVIGAVFLMLWIMSLRIGGRIDRERKEREAASAAGAEQDGDATA